jgi:3-deoxy-D-manno-octulosonic-acid transferase
MAKAKITTPEGITVDVIGTPEEIASVVEKIKKRRSGAKEDQGKALRGRTTKVLLVDLIGSLIDGKFFRTPRDLASIKGALAEMGHHYPVTTLSPTMLRQVRQRRLRRMREKGRWVYTG